ncbi:hypothetical protein IRM63_06225 [Leuconostoc citreum]|uniref:hypothetical protein n=1 Tax=Leuconostoc citreum TaxID=33964 RepID=UPI0018895E90|nr:hypothetical protein [Leuconostoc citreum]QOY97092.1 hypothetical protein IRM63_06225 [Leuconostoc citreum]
MEKLILTIITAFVSAGGLGFLNYQILEAQGAINIQDNSYSQKMWVAILSMFNFGLFLILSRHIDFVCSFFLTVLLSSVFFMMFGRIIFKLFWIFIDKSFDNEDHVSVSDEDPWEKFTNFPQNKEILVFIFDFEDNLIQHGYFVSANNSRSEKSGIFLTPFAWDTVNIDNVYDYVANGDLTRTYVDLNKKLKYFAVILNAEEPV